MAIITIDGYRGSGATEIGTRVAGALKATYIDRLLLGKAAEKVKAPINEMLGRTGRDLAPPLGLRAKFLRLLERWIDFYSHNAIFINPLEGFTFLGYYRDLDRLLECQKQPVPVKFIGHQAFREAMNAALQEVTRAENVVIVGRGAGMLLKDRPNALHVGLTASYPTRVIRNLRKHDFNAREAAAFTRQTDDARRRYFKQCFNASPDDPTNYTISLNTEIMSPELAAELIVSEHDLTKEGRAN